ncbi:MAG: YccF domain-containing protein [Actinomycetota bacterium]
MVRSGDCSTQAVARPGCVHRSRGLGAVRPEPRLRLTRPRSCITIIGIPFCMQAFTLSLLSLWPFGSTVVPDDQVAVAA